MSLREGLERAVRFVARGKVLPDGHEVLRGVRLLPRGEDETQPARAYAWDGECGVVVNLDCDVPSVLLEGSGAAAAVKGSKLLAFDGDVLAGDGGARFEVHQMDATRFVGLPDLCVPKGVTDGWWAVLAAVHAAAKDQDGDLGIDCLRLLPDVTEATDRLRAVRLHGGCGPEEGAMVPARLFKHWPKGEVVEVGFAPDMAFFRAGAELRFARRSFAKWPDLKGLVPERADCVGWAAPSTKELAAAVKAAAGVSPTKTVRLLFGNHGLQVGAWSEDDKAASQFQKPVQCERMGHLWQEIPVLVNGKLLHEALQHVDTPGVFLCHSGSRGPVRVETSRLTACVWPLIPTE